jgi:hypothetical protein
VLVEQTSINAVYKYKHAMQAAYRKYLGIFRNPAITPEIRSLDPETQHCRIIHLMTGYEFPWDVVRAREVALMRTFCSPSVSGLLHRTGEFRRHGQKRYDDTALLIAEFMHHGYDSDRGRQAIAHINKIHGLYQIANEDFLFVLSTFIFLPARWVDDFGWRRCTDNERQALYYFFKAVGQRMNIQNIPDSLEAFNRWTIDYEQKNFVPNATNTAVGDATVGIVKGWMPGIAKPFVLAVMKCLLDKSMLSALGYSRPPALLQSVIRSAMKLRALSLRRITFKHYPSFLTVEPNRTYPHGYEIKELGPEHIVARLNKSESGASA